MMLRVCASCEWVFEGEAECPKCKFGSYGAYYVFGYKAYTYKKTQHPWLEKKIYEYRVKLEHEIRLANSMNAPRTTSVMGVSG